MELTTTWFNLDENQNDLESVLTFLTALPSNILLIFGDQTSNFIKQFIEPDVDFGITPELFNQTFTEAKDELQLSLGIFRRNFSLDYIVGSQNADRRAGEVLKQIGFSQQSLKLKAAILNKLWKKVLDQISRFGKDIIDFTNNEIVKLVRRFLEYLNSLLGSLKELIPGLDGLIEFKEIIENYLSIADED